MISLQLEWPHRDLHPNARVHWATKAKRTKAYRHDAWAETKTKGACIGSPNLPVNVFIVFHPPDMRRRDRDGMLSSIKAGLDGIADALGIDDYLFRFHIEIGEPIKRGIVKIKVIEAWQHSIYP